MSGMEVIGGVGAIAGIVQQSFQLLDRVQMALDHNKQHTIHLTTVARDISGLKSIIQQIEKNTNLQAEPIKPTMEAILDLANKLNDLVIKQEAKTQKGEGFRSFAQSFAKGPKEQKQLEQLRDELMEHKNTLILCLVVDLNPSKIPLDINGVKMGGSARMQNGRVINTPKDRDFDSVAIRDVTMDGAAFMNNSAVTPDQQGKLLDDSSRTVRRAEFVQLLQNPAVPDSFKERILEQILQL